MQFPDPMTSLAVVTDADLVTAARSGERAAFAEIVQRYQRLLCSLAYSATGKLSQSEDLAQETFIEAWRQLATLREPEKLRPWLCGILRFKISRLRRSEHREPLGQADGLDAAADIASPDAAIADATVQKEEQAILWSALERVPESYREPLILYYREQRSVEHVAAALDLSEDAVKQRLARGRKILQEEVLAFVEGALARSTPGSVFTGAVLAALPAMVAPVKTTGLGAAAVKGSLAAKSTGVAALLASLSGVVSTALTLRAALDQSRTPRERRAVAKLTLALFFGALAFLAVIWGLRTAAIARPGDGVALAVISQVGMVGFVAGWPFILMTVLRHMRRMRSEERRLHPECFLNPIDHVGSEAGQYCSRWKLFGLPLVHLRFSSPDEGDPPVVAWIAGGDRAYGLLFAWGGLAVAPFSIGAVAVGLVSIGSLSLAAISIGTVATGLVALGCGSIGLNAHAWLSALGWQVAQSQGFAIARTAAEGPIAFARHANDAVARHILENPNGDSSQLVFIAVVSLVSIIPVALFACEVRRRLGKAARR